MTLFSHKLGTKNNNNKVLYENWIVDN
jgi:hypothetical protein